MDNFHYLLALNHTRRFGPRTIQKLLQKWPNLEKFFSLSFSELAEHGFSEKFIQTVKKIDYASVESDCEWLRQQDNRFIVTFEDPLYPRLLKEIYAPPPVLYGEGDWSCLDSSCLAIVGTRKPSVSGFEIAKEFSEVLASLGLVIVSGLARGIDAAAHQGALNGNGRTIAVLGTGVDKVYPKNHVDLVKKIKKSGLLISEFPRTSPPMAGHFPRRNRIISGVSSAVLVVESAVPSGSLLTARLALEQNRDVMAVPGYVRNPMAAGCHALLQQGARLVTKPQDVLDVFSIEETKTQQKKETDSPETASQRLLRCMGEGVTTVDQLVIRSGLSMEDIVCDLMELEIEGVVRSLPSGYVRCA